MLTFNEFLVQFSEEVQEVYSLTMMSENAKIAVVQVMRQYLGNRRFDPAELLGLFESVCYSAMNRTKIDPEELEDRVQHEAAAYLDEQDYSMEPDITFEEVEERRSMGR